MSTPNPFYISPPETPAAGAGAGLFSPGLYRPAGAAAAAGLFSPQRPAGAAAAAGLIIPGPQAPPLNSEIVGFGFRNASAQRVYDARQAAATANLQRAKIKLSLEAAQRKSPANATRIERLSRDLEIAKLLVIAAEIKTQLEIVKRESPANAVRIDQLTRNLDVATAKVMAVEAAGFAKEKEAPAKKGCCSVQGGGRRTKKQRGKTRRSRRRD